MRNLECVHCGATFGEETELATLRRERDEARANGATSERAAIVAMLHNEAFRLSAQADVTDDGYDANTMDDQARALRAAAERIERGKGDV